MRTRAAGVAMVVAMGLAVTAARAEAPPSWGRMPALIATNAAGTAPGEVVAVYRDGPEFRAATYGARGELLDDVYLDAGWIALTALDGSAAGGTVVAWKHSGDRELRVAQRRPGDRDFEVVASVPSGVVNYSLDRPQVEVNERGDAIVAFVSPAAGGGYELLAFHRSAGGSFGVAERVAGPAPEDTLALGDVALAPDGTAVIGYAVGGLAHVIERRPAGGYGPAETLGVPGPVRPYNSPRVGIDADGNVVASWLQEAEMETSGPVRVAFRHAGEPRFGPPLDTGVESNTYDGTELEVSAPGELLLVIEARRNTSDGRGMAMLGLEAFTGNAATGELSRPVKLSSDWGRFPSLAMNERGDATLAYEDGRPESLRARRRAPLGGFGPEEEVQAPIVAGEDRASFPIRSYGIDAAGNPVLAFEDLMSNEWFLARPLPAVTAPPPAVPPLDGRIAPVLSEGAEDDPPSAPAEEPEDDLPPSESSTGAVPSHPEGGLPQWPATTADAGLAPAPGVRIVVARATTARRISVRVRCTTTPCRVRLTGTLRGRRLGPAHAVLPARRWGRLAIKVPRRVRGGLVRLRAVATDPIGRTATGRATVRLNR